jgi:hypothetical protein
MTHADAQYEFSERRFVRCGGKPTGPYYGFLEDAAMEAYATRPRCVVCKSIARGTHVHGRHGTVVRFDLDGNVLSVEPLTSPKSGFRGSR